MMMAPSRNSRANMVQMATSKILLPLIVAALVVVVVVVLKL